MLEPAEQTQGVTTAALSAAACRVLGLLARVSTALMISAAWNSASAEALTAEDIDRLVDLCVEQTDINFKRDTDWPAVFESGLITAVGEDQSIRFANATILEVVDVFASALFKPEQNNEEVEQGVRLIEAPLRNRELALEYSMKRVNEQIAAANSLSRSKTAQRNGFWRRAGGYYGTAWWIADSGALVWRGNHSGLTSPLCEFYDVPSAIMEKFVALPRWGFDTQTRGKIVRYTTHRRARGLGTRTLLRAVTGIGREQVLPNAVIEATEFPAGYVAEYHTSPWVVVVSFDFGDH